ncbi:MAG: hypothetical protein ACK2T4_01635 [Candidatus Promineifilaceae bacterium]
MEEILSNLSGTVSPWLMGTFFTLGLVASIAAVKSWHEMKRSPYFFQRLQAGKRLQTYLSSSFALFVVTLIVGFYAWQEPVDTTVRSAIISNSKPIPEVVEVKQETYPSIDETIVDESISTDAAEIALGLAEPNSQVISVLEQPLVATQLSLPEDYDRFEPKVDLKDNSNLGTLSFSTEITDEYEAVEPGQLFAEGFYTLYATFDYEGLEDGMVWSWIWRHDGEVIEGGNEMWVYGQDGPGYIFFSPEEGFRSGQYSLDVWVNGELMAQSSAVMNNASISANN